MLCDFWSDCTSYIPAKLYQSKGHVPRTFSLFPFPDVTLFLFSLTASVPFSLHHLIHNPFHIGRSAVALHMKKYYFFHFIWSNDSFPKTPTNLIRMIYWVPHNSYPRFTPSATAAAIEGLDISYRHLFPLNLSSEFLLMSFEF